jgi:uncharacterized protein YutE (UPF0331/DUF86 family)
MVDQEVLQHKINIVENNLTKMETLAALPEKEFLDKFFYVESAKHLLQVSVEALLDIANHIIARERYRSPHTYAESFLILVEQKIIPKDMENAFIQMARFRNRVVHLYHEVDDKEVYQILRDNLNDFRVFIGAIIKKFL